MLVSDVYEPELRLRSLSIAAEVMADGQPALQRSGSASAQAAATA